MLLLKKILSKKRKYGITQKQFRRAIFQLKQFKEMIGKNRMDLTFFRLILVTIKLPKLWKGRGCNIPFLLLIYSRYADLIYLIFPTLLYIYICVCVCVRVCVCVYKCVYVCLCVLTIKGGDAYFRRSQLCEYSKP